MRVRGRRAIQRYVQLRVRRKSGAARNDRGIRYHSGFPLLERGGQILGTRFSIDDLRPSCPRLTNSKAFQFSGNFPKRGKHHGGDVWQCTTIKFVVKVFHRRGTIFRKRFCRSRQWRVSCAPVWQIFSFFVLTFILLRSKRFQNYPSATQCNLKRVSWNATTRVKRVSASLTDSS